MSKIAIQHKRSSVSGKRPVDSDLLVGELALNFKDRTIHTKDGSGNIIRLAKDFSDSDILAIVDSEIVKLNHDFISSDSDLYVIIKNQHDSDLLNLSLDDLDNVYTPNPKHNESLVWDSDLSYWVPLPIAVSGFTAEQVVEEFNATADQTVFTLTDHPNGEVVFMRNGVLVDNRAISNVLNVVTFNPALNNNNALDSDDVINISYVKTASATQLPKMANVDDVTLTSVKEGDTLVYDSDTQEWINKRVSLDYVSETFITTVNQTLFTLSNTPQTVTGFFRNGMRILDTGWELNSNEVTYIPSGNGNSNIADSDNVQITYFK